jgi:hypothetical protein
LDSSKRISCKSRWAGMLRAIVAWFATTGVVGAF